jgi:hypothetical protein
MQLVDASPASPKYLPYYKQRPGDGSRRIRRKVPTVPSKRSKRSESPETNPVKKPRTMASDAILRSEFLKRKSDDQSPSMDDQDGGPTYKKIRRSKGGDWLGDQLQCGDKRPLPSQLKRNCTRLELKSTVEDLNCTVSYHGRQATKDDLINALLLWASTEHLQSSTY